MFDRTLITPVLTLNWHLATDRRLIEFILSQCSISILPENVRKPLEHCAKMG